MDQPVKEDFRRRAQALGLTKLSDADLAVLEKGWQGLQPQLKRLREGLRMGDRPARPRA